MVNKFNNLLKDYVKNKHMEMREEKTTRRFSTPTPAFKKLSKLDVNSILPKIDNIAKYTDIIGKNTQINKMKKNLTAKDKLNDKELG